MAEASAKHQGETTVDLICRTQVSVVDGQGKIVRGSEGGERAGGADCLVFEVPLARIGLEAGPLSQWLFAGLQASGLAVELFETRHVPRRL
ncbi:hypothetical protein [Mesorhizobium sp. M0590]|uniref:hypothetical protein n=1 Tax=Mesorhizobium sp. M0590 TaxID=2956966 RepID=UPI00333C98E2